MLDPALAKQMRPLGDTFVKLVKMVIGPIIFLTIVLGIARIADVKKIGRVGGKALLYFEIVTTFALAIGLTVVNVTRPGAGLDVSAMPKGDVSAYAAQGQGMKFTDFVTHIVPSSPVDAFAQGDILQIVFFAVLFGFAVVTLGKGAAPLTSVLETTLDVFFRIVALIMKVAPLGAFGAMAFTVGTFGLQTLLPLGRLMLDVYLTMFLFIFVVLNLIMRWYGFSLWAYLKYIREEILIVLGTSSSEAALPGHDGQARAIRVRAAGGGARDSDGVLVQPRRHEHLSLDGDGLPRAGLRRAADDRSAARDPRGADDHLEGRRRRHRLGIHRAREHARGDEGRADRGHRAAPRRRPLHERGARDHEPHRQRRRDAGDFAQRA